MTASGTDKKKQKRKAKQKQIKTERTKQVEKEKGWDYYNEARHFFNARNTDKAVKAMQKAIKALPHEADVIHLQGHIGNWTNNLAMELDAMERLEKIGQMTDDIQIDRVMLLFIHKKYEECLMRAKQVLQNFPLLDVKNKRKTMARIKEIKDRCHNMLVVEQSKKKITKETISFDRNPVGKKNILPKTPFPEALDEPRQQPLTPPVVRPVPEIPRVPLTFHTDKPSFFKVLSNPEPAGPDQYELLLASHDIRFTESFENLICLSSLTMIQSFWYQEETAKKVLKQYRGRALLSDEVGLGKTIEALIILSEYIKRGMVKTGLILTPAPLVSQWKEEMISKFNLDVPSTDDPGFRSGEKAFWDQPFVIASINQAKSAKNMDYITAREYDIIIIDEAHHLKNRTTLNWKLVNDLKKRFILLLTATPVENNLMELYNLITLLKPGQLETATAFKEKFMKRGDPTDPQNRTILRGLLSQVMIRNTRALAGIHIPPRFARTIRIEPTKAEKEFYNRLQTLILDLNEKKQGKARLIIRNLLAQAGSSPKAVEHTLTNMLEKQDYLFDHEQEIRAVKNLCRTTLDTPKNKALLKLIQATRDKIIVFVKYRGTVEHLTEFLEWNNISFSLFHGSLTSQEKDAAIDAFKSRTQVLVTTEIGGEGRNMQFCSQMVNYDLPWNPMKIEQRIGRIHRIGQEKEVQIYNFCAAGSIEDYILDILDRKINMFEMVIGEIDMILGRISGEKEFSDMVCDIWLNSKTTEERDASFAGLGTKLKRAKAGYEKTRELDGKLFGDTYEL